MTYSVPSMEEIAKVRGTNGYKVVSTFSGCGGSCLGFEMAGYEVVWASEFIAAARQTYEKNHPGVHIDPRDIRLVKPEDILQHAGLERGELDVLEGSPPCASFSTSGARAKNWGKAKSYSDSSQRTDDLFFEFARILEGLQPKVFVAENVKGLVMGQAKGYFKEIHQALRSCGYKVKAAVLDAQFLGVPQTRPRTIFVGVRDDLGLEPRFPSPTDSVITLRDACPWIGTDDDPGNIDPETGQDLSFVGMSLEPFWRELREGQDSKERHNLKKTSRRRPVKTLVQSAGGIGTASITHPTQPRKFNLEELRRLCGFPDDFILEGSYSQRTERLGRAVPPVMMSKIAGTVKEILDAC